MYAGIRILNSGRLVNFVIVVLLLAGSFQANAVYGAPDPVGRASLVSGAVTVERTGRTEALKAESPVFMKDMLRTGESSAVEIAFPDGSRIKLAANTTLEITEYVYNPNQKVRQGLLSLVAGKSGLAVQELQEFRDKRFRVQTRTAVVGSRDTLFVVMQEPENSKDSVCSEGMVTALALENAIVVYNVGSPEKPVLLTPNMISQVCGRNLPTPPRFVTAAERARIVAGLEDFLKIGGPPGVSGQSGALSPWTGGTEGPPDDPTKGFRTTEPWTSSTSTTTTSTTTTLMGTTTTTTTSIRPYPTTTYYPYPPTTTYYPYPTTSTLPRGTPTRK